MANIGVLTVDMRLLSKKFEAGVKRANAGLTKMRLKATSVTKSLGGMNAGIAGLIGVAGIGAMVKKSLDAGDAIGKMSDRLNISTESLSAFSHLVELNGETTEGFEKSLTRMVRSLGEAERGFGTGKKALEDLGISLDQLTGKSADEQFLIISDAISKVDSASRQASISSDIFGRSGVTLLNTIAQGREGFESARKEVEKYGLSLSRIDAAKIEAANDAILRAKKVMEGAAMTATTQLAPYLEEVANQFVELGTEGEGFAGIFKNVAQNVVVGWAHMKNAATGVVFVFDMVKSGLYNMGAAFANVFNTIINDVIRPAVNSMTELLMSPFKRVLEFAADYSDGAAEMLNSIQDGIKFDRIQGLDTFAFNMQNAAYEARSAMYETLSDIIPVDELKENIEEVFVKAEERATEAAQKIKENPIAPPPPEKPSEEEEQSPAEKQVGKYDFILSKEKTFQEKLGMIRGTASKKFAAVQKAIALKEAIVTGFSAIQKAWNVPYPGNLLTVPLTTAAVAANIQGIRGQAHSGIDYVPREGTWLLDKGERVVDSRTNSDLKGFLKDGSGATSPSVSINLSVNSRRPNDIMDEVNSIKKPLVRMLQTAMSAPI